METKNEASRNAAQERSSYGGQLTHFLASRAFFSLHASKGAHIEEEPELSQPLHADRDRSFVGNRLFLLA